MEDKRWKRRGHLSDNGLASEGCVINNIKQPENDLEGKEMDGERGMGINVRNLMKNDF